MRVVRGGALRRAPAENRESVMTSQVHAQFEDDDMDQALRAYWSALQGTIDPQRIAQATNNALVGNPEEIAKQIVSRFHREDRLMLWFDFFNHKSDQVIGMMRCFMKTIVPRVEQLQQEKDNAAL